MNFFGSEMITPPPLGTFSKKKSILGDTGTPKKLDFVFSSRGQTLKPYIDSQEHGGGGWKEPGKGTKSAQDQETTIQQVLFLIENYFFLDLIFLVAILTLAPPPGMAGTWQFSQVVLSKG